MLGLTPFKMGLPLVLVLLTTNPAISIGPWVQHALHSERDGRRGLQASDPRGLVSTLATFSDAWYSVAVSPDGAFALMVVGISNGGRILKITLANNNVTTLAGSVKGYADGTGKNAKFDGLECLDISPDGKFALLGETGNHRIRKLDLDTTAVTSLAGSSKGFADGKGTNAKFDAPQGVAIDPKQGKFALVTDRSCRIRKLIITTQVVTTLAGATGCDASQSFGCSCGNPVDGVGNKAKFYNPHGISLSPDASFALITSPQGMVIRKLVLATNNVTTIAGKAGVGHADGYIRIHSLPFCLYISSSLLVHSLDRTTDVYVCCRVGLNAKFSYPYDVSISRCGQFAVIVQTGNGTDAAVRMLVLASRNVTTLAGKVGTGEGFADGKGSNARFASPRGISLSPDSTFALVADSNNKRLRKLIVGDACESERESEPEPQAPPAFTPSRRAQMGPFLGQTNLKHFPSTVRRKYITGGLRPGSLAGRATDATGDYVHEKQAVAERAHKCAVEDSCPPPWHPLYSSPPPPPPPPPMPPPPPPPKAPWWRQRQEGQGR